MDYIIAMLIYASQHEFGIECVDPIELIYYISLNKDSNHD